MSDKITIDGREFDVAPDGLPFAFSDLPRSHFPFLVRWLAEEEGKSLGQGRLLGWHMVTDMEIMKVPGFRKAGFKVSTNIQTADGISTLVTSDGKDYSAEMPASMVEAVLAIAAKVESGELENGRMPPWEEKPDA